RVNVVEEEDAALMPLFAPPSFEHFKEGVRDETRTVDLIIRRPGIPKYGRIAAFLQKEIKALAPDAAGGTEELRIHAGHFLDECGGLVDFISHSGRRGGAELCMVHRMVAERMPTADDLARKLPMLCAPRSPFGHPIRR